MNPSKIIPTTTLVIFTLLSFLAVVGIPYIDKALTPSSDAPGAITIIGVGLVITFLMIGALYFGITSSTSVPKKFLTFFVLYNALVVVVKFSLAPGSLYLANQSQVFEALFSIFNNRGSVDPFFLLCTTALIFLLYFLVFWILYRYFKKKLARELDIPAAPKSKKHSVPKFIGLALIVGLIIVAGGGGILFIPLFFAGFPALQYLGYIFSTWVSLFIALALTGAVYFVNAAFKSAAEQARVLRDVLFLVSFFWMGAAFLFIYHALWVVYLLVLTALWPLRVVVPK